MCLAAVSNDPDAGVLFAEALMDLRPWDLWTADGRLNRAPRNRVDTGIDFGAFPGSSRSVPLLYPQR